MSWRIRTAHSDLTKNSPVQMNQLSLNFPVTRGSGNRFPSGGNRDQRTWIDINALTPLEALLKINEWRKSILND